MNWIQSVKKRFARTVENEVEEWDTIPPEERLTSVVIITVFGLLILYLAIHQIWSTGFFTAAFGTFEMVMLYGSLSVWIITSVLMLLGHKNPSRDFDSFGGYLFATLGIVWVFVVFPFDFAFFADVLPDFLRFLLQWISNDVARVLMVLSIIVNLCIAVYSLVLRLSVRRIRK